MIAATLTADGALGDAASGTTDSGLAVGSTHLATRSDVATTQLVDAWAAPTACRRRPGRARSPPHATAWGVRSLVVSDHAATWVDLEPVSADG